MRDVIRAEGKDYLSTSISGLKFLNERLPQGISMCALSSFLTLYVTVRCGITS